METTVYARDRIVPRALNYVIDHSAVGGAK
jgi:hypothetical protein